MAQNYHDVIVWQKAIHLMTCVYRLTQAFPKTEPYGPTSQMRRAAASVASNVPEGRCGLNAAEFRQLLGRAQDPSSKQGRSFGLRRNVDWALRALLKMQITSVKGPQRCLSG